MKLSIVIPAYNEEANFKRRVLDEVSTYLKKQKYSFEVILVNDGSTDNTLKLLNGFVKNHTGFRVLDTPHAGKVAAVSSGMMDAKGEFVIFTDFDQSTPINHLDLVLAAFKKGADVVIGERPSKDVNWSIFQTIRSKLFNLLVQIMALPGIEDSQCGFKAFHNRLGKKLFSELKITKHTQKGAYMGAFDVELLFLAKKYGYKISSIPVSWRYFKSKRLTLSEPIKMALDVIRVRIFDLVGGYQAGSKNKITYKKHLLPVLLLLILTTGAFKDTIKIGYFPMHDDLQFTRHLVMDECFKDLQIPCRWSKHLGYGYGYPIFNYYPPLPYYLGQPFRWLGLQYVDVVKVLVVLNFIVSGLSMYLLAQAFWGRWGGVIAALLYVYAPYHAVDVYARGAINEAWAIAFFPAIFWSLYKLTTTNKWFYVPMVAFSLALLMLVHNPILMVFAFGMICWVIFWLIYSKKFLSFFKLILAACWAFSLAAFFTLPVIFESKYAHIETLIIGYFNYLAHFANLYQLFISRNWGFGDSRFGPVDDISFQIGHLHWILSALSLVVALIIARKKQQLALVILMLFILTTAYTFMTHVRSSFIWSFIPQLSYLQFPWRFLSLTIFGTSFLAGSVIILLDLIPFKKLKIFTFMAILLATIFLYKDYFKWRAHWPWMTDGYRYTENLWKLQITSGIFDYLPIWAPRPPGGPPNGDSEIVEGGGEVQTIFKNSIRQQYQVKVKTDATLQINTYYFPGWRYFINSKEIKDMPNLDKELGRPLLKLPAGDHFVMAKLTNTPVRTIANILSSVAWVVLLGLIFYRFLPFKR